jgi:hypothetical protein
MIEILEKKVLKCRLTIANKDFLTFWNLKNFKKQIWCAGQARGYFHHIAHYGKDLKDLEFV